MPSQYEPCGLNQIYSLRYGTVPVVRATGGLDDTVHDYHGGEGNGFKFRKHSARALVNKVSEALRVFADREAWKKLCQKGMAEDFSWHASAERYIRLYDLVISRAAAAAAPPPPPPPAPPAPEKPAAAKPAPPAQAKAAPGKAAPQPDGTAKKGGKTA